MNPSVRYLTAESDLLIFDITTGDSRAPTAAFAEVRGQVSLVRYGRARSVEEAASTESEPAWDEILLAPMFSDDEGEEPLPGRLA